VKGRATRLPRMSGPFNHLVIPRACPAASLIPRPRACAWAALFTIWLGGLPLAWGEPAPARLTVSMLESDGASIQLRLRIPARLEPTIDLTSAPTPASRRLVLAWPGVVALDRPLPDPAARGDGTLQSLTLHASADASQLALLLNRPVQAQLRRVADSWVLRIDPEPAPASAAMTAAAPRTAAPAPPVQSAPDTARTTVSDNAALPAPPQSAPPVRTGRSAVPEQLLLDVIVNGRPLGDVVRAELWPDNTLLLPVESWTEARLTPLAPIRALSDGTPAYAVGAIAGATYAIDRQALNLKITVPPSAFAASTVASELAPVVPPSRPHPGVVLNYDLSASYPGHGSPVAAGAVLEAMAFGAAGNLVTSALVRDGETGRRVERLDTFWRYDMPGRMQTLVLGDTVGVGGGWSRPVRFAGVRLGRDFGMRPGFVTLPQLALSGEAALPSTVDVLVNNARRMSEPVPPGPFELTNVPIVTGAGEINLVVRDLLGQETVMRQSYYASPRLLAPGLSDFSLEGGRMRFGYGEGSRYGDGFAAATLRAGLTRALSGEVRLELQADRRAAGLELTGLLGDWAVAHAALAASRGSSQGTAAQGQLLRLGIERSTPHGGGALEYEYAGAGFAPFGELPGPAAAGRRPRTRLMASVGGPVVGRLSGGISYVRQILWGGDQIALAGASISLPLWQRSSMNLSANKRLDGDRAWRAGFNVSLPLTEGVHLAARADRDNDGRASATLAASHPAPAGSGLGWNVETSTVESQRARGALQYNASMGELTANLVSDAHGRLAARAGARGSLGLLAKLPFASRPIGQGSFAVVEVEGMAGVPIKRSHQVVATTNAHGMAFVPGLLPWQKNQLEIDPDDLPLDAVVGDVVQEITPYPGSGTVVTFKVRRTRQALLVLHQPSGQPVPLGTRVRLLPDGPEFIAGLRGEAWLTDLPAGRARLRVSWPNGGCVLELPPPTLTGAPERIGPLACGKQAQ
jgi:outer membrane usher protein